MNIRLPIVAACALCIAGLAGCANQATAPAPATAAPAAASTRANAPPPVVMPTAARTVAAPVVSDQSTREGRMAEALRNYETSKTASQSAKPPAATASGAKSTKKTTAQRGKDTNGSVGSSGTASARLPATQTQ